MANKTKSAKSRVIAADEGARDHVTFRAAIGTVAEPRDAAADLVRHAKTAGTGGRPVKVRPHVSYSGLVTVRVYWQGDRFHTVKIASTDDGRLLASHKPTEDRTVPLLLRSWLTASDRFTDVAWSTAPA